MAFYELLVKEDLSPCDCKEILQSLYNLQDRIKVDTHYATETNRKNNIALTMGLIRPYFVKKEPSALKHGKPT